VTVLSKAELDARIAAALAGTRPIAEHVAAEVAQRYAEQQTQDGDDRDEQ
jgi:hypothetical protein